MNIFLFGNCNLIVSSIISDHFHADHTVIENNEISRQMNEKMNEDTEVLSILIGNMLYFILYHP